MGWRRIIYYLLLWCQTWMQSWLKSISADQFKLTQQDVTLLQSLILAETSYSWEQTSVLTWLWHQPVVTKINEGQHTQSDLVATQFQSIICMPMHESLFILEESIMWKGDTELRNLVRAKWGTCDARDELMREHQNKHTHTHTHTTLTHTSLLYVHRVSSSRSLGILLNTQMLCLNKSSTELIGFCEVLF